MKVSSKIKFLILILLICPVFRNNVKGKFDRFKGSLDDPKVGLNSSVRDWTITEVISTESDQDSWYPAIAIDFLGSIYVVWEDLTDYKGSGTDSDIFYKCWNASTNTWTATEVISAESTQTSTMPSIGVDRMGNVHIIWVDHTNYNISGVNSDIFYKRWNATTNTWTATEEISNNSNTASSSPSIGVDRMGNVHILWVEYMSYSVSGVNSDIFYKRWNATTNTWTATEEISNNSNTASLSPSIATDRAGDLYVTWHEGTIYNVDGKGTDILYKHWNATTKTWSPTEVVSTESTHDSMYPSIAVDAGGNVHISWEDYTDLIGTGNGSNIFYKRWNATNSLWTMTEVISTGLNFSSEHSMVVDDIGNLHLLWQSITEGSHLFYRRWNANNDTWTKTEWISTETNQVSFPSIAVDSVGRPHAVWNDRTDYNNSGTDYDIFYKTIGNVPNAPILNPITPNPSTDGKINMNWNNVSGATSYYIYEDTSIITSWSLMNFINFKRPFRITSDSTYQFNTSNGTYYFVIIAVNSTGKSSMSNCEGVKVALIEMNKPAPNYFFTIFIVIVVVVIVLVFIAKRTARH
jgi:hypothetical protein